MIVIGLKVKRIKRDLHKQISSYLFQRPHHDHEQVIGVITLESSEREYAFSEIDTRPIMTIASSLAVAIEKHHYNTFTKERA